MSALLPSDPATIIAGIREFGLAADGSDLRDLEAAIASTRARPAAEASKAARIIVTGDREGVCIGGKFDGWRMRKHPDGQWVSVEKLPTADPYEGLPAFLRPAAPTDGGEHA